ncbi:WG repeat-containing protein [Flavobacterium sp.]|uniref:WG repeat-containing protein n=1 Tax=Flavobacterium sp. TaxID=239 RepID=UPI00260CB51A|nr:WG repeat-containing protein [Flavobacterium sp.]
MHLKTYLFTFLSLLIFYNSNGQIRIASFEFDKEKKGPTIVYYNFYNDIQMIEIEYNNYEKARVDHEDAIKPISSIRPRNYGHNAIIFRTKNGELLHQYNLKGNAFKPTDFLPAEKCITVTHSSRLNSKYVAKTNYPSYGKYNFFVTENNKAGLIDTLGTPILEVVYDGLLSYNHNFNLNSFVMFDTRNDQEQEKCFYTMKSNGKWGFKSDKITIEPKYDDLIPIKQNVLKIKKNNKYGLINEKEESLIEPIYTDLIYKNDFYLYTTEGIENIDKYATLYGIIDFNFKIKTQPIYNNIDDIIENYYPSGKYWACKTDGCGAIDKNGNEISKFKYGSMPQNPYNTFYRTTGYRDSNKYYILNLDFEEIGKNYDAIYDWKNQLFTVKKGSKLGLIDLNNKVVLPCEYDSFWQESRSELGTLIKNKKYGVITSKGVVVIPCKYDDLYFTVDNTIVATLIDANDKTNRNRKVGLLSANGNQMTSFVYDEIETIDYGFYRVRIDTKYGVLNKDGKEITPVKYDEIYRYRNGFCIAKLDFGYGFIDTSGKEITHFYYEKPSDFNYNAAKKLRAKAYLRGKEVIIDENGKVIY